MGSDLLHVSLSFRRVGLASVPIAAFGGSPENFASNSLRGASTEDPEGEVVVHLCEVDGDVGVLV